MALTIGARNQLARAGSTQIEAVFKEISSDLQKKVWLNSTNPYRREPLKSLNADHRAKSVNGKELSRFIAASVLTHAIDGWSYLGRALSAYMSGDLFAAIHLAYYSEFRAASSTLAAYGIGVFDEIHAVVDDRQNASVFTGGGAAHVFIWDALQYLAQTPEFSNGLMNEIVSNRSPLGDWLEQFDQKLAGPRIAENWITSWGVDLAKLAQDKEGRNLVSYTPTAFVRDGAASANANLTYSIEIWKLLEPDAAGRFVNLDRLLIWSAIRGTYGTAFGEMKFGSQDFKGRVSTMLTALALDEMERKTWYQFLTNKPRRKDSLLLEAARGTKAAYEAGYADEIIARTVLLLRIATGAAASLLRASGIPRRYLSFWLDSVGQERCLWAPTKPPARYSDLWSDIEEANAELERWQAGDSEKCFYNLWHSEAQAASVLSSAERVGLWGIRV